jgi:hypothetical protein
VGSRSLLEFCGYCKNIDRRNPAWFANISRGTVDRLALYDLTATVSCGAARGPSTENLRAAVLGRRAGARTGCAVTNYQKSLPESYIP